MNLKNIPTYILASLITITQAKLTWEETKFLFAFGDSYTTDGFNISAGIDSPVPGFVSLFSLAGRGFVVTRDHLDIVERTKLGKLSRSDRQFCVSAKSVNIF